MAINLEYDNKVILNCKNAIWDVIHKNIIEIIKKENMRVSTSIKQFLEKSDQEVYGVGAIYPDLDQIKSKKNMLVLADLVKRAIEKWIDEVPDLPDDYKRSVWRFHKNLLEITEELD